ncbi:MAG: helix-turn-helix domain-containing protein [Hyphomicrobium sp.]|nr:helix-turn-helix domain-containing protein [Hyphomicrobium sp.]
MRRDDIYLYVSRANRARLAAIIKDRNSSCKAVWRAEIVLATADGAGTNEIMRRTGKSKPCVWRWQERFVEAGVDGLLRDKTRPSRVSPLPDKVKLAVLTRTAKETPANATHLEPDLDGGGRRHQPVERRPHLARSRPQAASYRDSLSQRETRAPPRSDDAIQ